MLIKSIELKNFRQFKGKQKIIFSTNKNDNITVIKGENGAGKTTLLEAFLWCLYGELNLPNKEKILTEDIGNELKPNDTEDVFVEVNLIHHNKEYIMRRLHSFMKLNNGDLDRVSKIEKVLLKNPDGTLTENIDKEEIYNILPDELSTYFFFDGERIENLSKANREGKKDISNAVKNILGLDILLDAEKHLKKIIKEFEDEYSEDNQEEMKQLKNDLEDLRSKKDNFKQLIETKTEEKEILNFKIEELNEKIKKNSSAQKDQQLREKYEDQIYNNKEDILSLKKDIEKNNKNSFPEFLANKLIELCSDKINLSDIETKGILGIDGSAIDTIIKRGECICGQKVVEGNKNYKNLVEQKEFQPPASLGTIILQFNSQTSEVKKTGEDFFEDFKGKYISIEKKRDSIENLNKEINNISDRLKSAEDVKSLEVKRETKKDELQKIQNEIIQYTSELNIIESTIDSKESELDKLALNNNKNNKIAIRKAYTAELRKKIKKYYEKKENQIRQDLNKQVGKIFKQLIETNHQIKINDDYTFEVVDIDGNTSTSQGQNVITSFAFIGGLINLAKDKLDDIEVTEPYPLVMDAPFSKLSNAHRENVIKLLPEIAEQFILFTVDSQFDGEVEKTVQPKIGQQYNLKMHMDNKKYTEIIGG